MKPNYVKGINSRVNSISLDRAQVGRISAFLAEVLTVSTSISPSSLNRM
jgi:hypothetical protein